MALAGWTLSYLKSQSWHDEAWKEEVDRGLKELERVTKKHGPILILETLGTASLKPIRNNLLFEHLETRGYARRWFRTDYTFSSRLESLVLSEFFFGKNTVAQANAFLKEGVVDALVLPECTGIWTKRNGQS